jgi:glycosyltransferase involved in cell wall biosynthesis
MRKVTCLYGSGTGFSGQRFASELLIAGLVQRGWQVGIIKTPLLDRIEGHSSVKRLLEKLGLGIRLLAVWLKGTWVALGPTLLYVNLGQTRFALIRDGVPLLIRGIFNRDRQAVISLHGNLFTAWDRRSLEARLLRQMARPARYITVLGPNQEARLAELGVPAEKIVQVDNTCLIPPVTEQECVDKQAIHAHQTLNILFLSSLSETKGYPEFVEAISKLSSIVTSPVEATVCGKITLMDADTRFTSHAAASDWLEEQISEVNCSSQVRLRWVSGAAGAAKEKLFREAHIFVLPSRYRVETQPIAILEALASGCAVIATQIGEIPSTLNDRTALLLGEATPDAIATAIEGLLGNPDRRRDLALNGLRLFKERFDYEKHLDHWEELLLATAGERRSPGK